MKGWHSLIPVLFILWGALILISLIDKQALEQAADQKIRMETPAPVAGDHNAPVYRAMARLQAQPNKRECGYYVSRRVGLREYLGIVCVERNTEINMEVIRHGRIDMSHQWYLEEVQPVVDSLKSEYMIKYGW